MAEDNVETEIKLWVTDLGLVEARLISLDAQLHAPRILERNSRYDLPDGSLTANGVVLRLRQDSRARLTYKEAGTLKDGIMSRFEAEVEVSDFDAMETILKRLDYVFAFAYEKYRTTYKMYDCEITLDEMPFGSFVEIEGEHTDILRVLNDLELADALRIEMSYSGAFNVLRKCLDLSFTDATFANFQGVTLPENVGNLLHSRDCHD